MSKVKVDRKYYKDGSIRFERYYLDDKRHREDGPARIDYNKDGSIHYESYYLNDKEVEPFKVIKATNLAKRMYPDYKEKEGFLYV